MFLWALKVQINLPYFLSRWDGVGRPLSCDRYSRRPGGNHQALPHIHPRNKGSEKVSGDTVLVKASNSMKFSEIVEALTEFEANTKDEIEKGAKQ